MRKGEQKYEGGNDRECDEMYVKQNVINLRFLREVHCGSRSGVL
jgi:hypothetical protein